MPDDVENDRTESADSADTRGRKPRRGAGTSPRLLIAAAVVLAVIIAVLAGVVWYRQSSGDSYSDEQVADAEKAVCTAAGKVQRGMVLNTHLQKPDGDDRAGALAVMANARLSLTAGGAYLHDVLDAQPAAPQELTDAVKTWATTLEALGISYLAGETNEAREPLHKELAGEFKQVGELCKD